MKEIHLHSLEDTSRFAAMVADLVRDETLTICLDGDLGAGKTTWTKAFGKALGVKSTINSPTFTIMKTYKMGDGRQLVHIDAYRLEGAHQDLGFEENFDEGITVIEWGTYIQEQIPEDHLSISLSNGVDEERTFVIDAHGPKAEKVLEAIVW